jgi:hypothetical protein
VVHVKNKCTKINSSAEIRIDFEGKDEQSKSDDFKETVLRDYNGNRRQGTAALSSAHCTEVSRRATQLAREGVGGTRVLLCGTV